MFLTDVSFRLTIASLMDNPSSDIPNAMWRYDPQARTFLPVIFRAELGRPNGARMNKDGMETYVDDYCTTF